VQAIPVRIKSRRFIGTPPSNGRRWPPLVD
jgi:hypothetical protein